MTRLRSFALLLALSASASSAFALTIAEGRQLALGTEVTLEGQVITASGIFATSTFDQGFAIDDGSAGIYVSLADNAIVGPYQKVQVTGVLADDGFGQLILKPASLAQVLSLPGFRRERADNHSTGEIGEATEGSLVAVMGRVTRIANDIPYGYKVYIDDGSGEVQIFFAASTGVNPYRLPYIEVGATIEVVGLSSQFEDEYEVLPRTYSDVRSGL